MITKRIYEWAHSQPNKTALIHNDVSITYWTFARSIETLRNFFRQQDLVAGQTAIVLVQNLADAWAIVMALRSLGLNTNTVGSVGHAENLKIRSAACLVVIEAEQNLHSYSSNALIGTKVIIVPKASSNVQRGELVLGSHDVSLFGGHMLFTSGTTGTYKKLIHKGEYEEKRNIVRARQLSFGKETVAHVFDFPLWTGAGFKQPSAVWYMGGCIILDQTQSKYSNAFKYGITFASVVPPMVNALIASRKNSAAHPNSHTEFALGGGFVSPQAAKQVVRDLNSRLTSYYSSTETGGIVMYMNYVADDDLYWFIPSFQGVEIVDEFGMNCAVGQEGQLRVLLTEIDCNCYLDDTEASAQVFRDGFFYPGDMAVRRSDGRIRILGRTDDVVNLRGLKRAAAPIEQAIRNDLLVDEVCVFSSLDDKGNEEFVIAIETDREVERKRLQAVSREFESFGRVRCVMFKKFPRAETGMRKIQRSTLRRLIFKEIITQDNQA